MSPSMEVAAGPPSEAPCPLPARPGILHLCSSSADADRGSFRSRLLGFRINDIWATRKVRADASANSAGGAGDKKPVTEGVEDSTRGDGKEAKEIEDEELREFRAKMMDHYRIAVDRIQRAYKPMPAKRVRRDDFRFPSTVETNRDRRQLTEKIDALSAVDSIHKRYSPAITEKPRLPPAVASPSNKWKDVRAGPGASSSSRSSTEAKAGPSGGAALLPPSKPWNLRKRKSVYTLLQALAVKQQDPQPHVETASEMSSGVEVSSLRRLEKKREDDAPCNAH